MAGFRAVIKSITRSAPLNRNKRSRRKVVKFPIELSEDELKIVAHVIDNRLSMTSPERLFTTIMACRHAVDRHIEGDFVECGVWRGGNAMLAAAVLKANGSGRKLYLYDTFEGMTAPSDEDTALRDGARARDLYLERRRDTHNEWCYASIEDVKSNFLRAGLLDENVVFVKGDVLQTLQDERNIPRKIAVLRLDTDWYESTRRELEVLYPRLSVGGVLILDDYGYWAGAKKATDEYFAANGHRPFLQYIDHEGRVGVKFD
jgi:O-methyltransferase